MHLTHKAADEADNLLVELLSELVCSALLADQRRWRGLRPAERAAARTARLAVERRFQRQVEAALVAQLLGTRDFKLVS